MRETKLKLTIYPNLICVVITLLMAIAFAFPQPVNAAEKDKSAKRAALMMQKMKQDMQAQMDADKATMQAQLDTQKKELEDKLTSKDEELAKQAKKLAAAAERKNNALEANIAKVFW